MRKIILALVLVLSVKAYSKTDFEISTGPYLQNITESEATLIWSTTKNAIAWVEVAPDDSLHFYGEERVRYYNTYLGKKKVGTLHSVRLKGLKPGENYRYRIYSQEVLEETSSSVLYGKVVATKVSKTKPLQFKTLPIKKNDFSFVMVNDIHENNELLQSLLKNVKNENINFVVFNGDMVSNIRSKETILNGFLTKSIDLFATEIPFYYARGNHETRGVAANEFMNYFPSSTGLPYYSFQQGNAFFVVLDSGEDKPDSDIEYNGLAAYDEYRIGQQKWLKDVVKSDAFKNAAFKIVIMHIPPMLNPWHGSLHVKKLFVPILNDAGIDLMLCGHKHQHIFLKAGNEGCNFPVLINSNKNKANVSVTEQNININIFNELDKLEFEMQLNKK